MDRPEGKSLPSPSPKETIVEKLVVLGVLFASVSAPAMAAQQSCSRNLSQIWLNTPCAVVNSMKHGKGDGHVGTRSIGASKASAAHSTTAAAATHHSPAMSSVSGAANEARNAPAASAPSHADTASNAPSPSQPAATQPSNNPPAGLNESTPDDGNHEEAKDSSTVDEGTPSIDQGITASVPGTTPTAPDADKDKDKEHGCSGGGNCGIGQGNGGGNGTGNEGGGRGPDGHDHQR